MLRFIQKDGELDPNIARLGFDGLFSFGFSLYLSLLLDILAAPLSSIALIILYNLNHNILLIVIAHAQKQITA